MGTEKRRPKGGALVTVQVETDGVDGGMIELFDCDGEELGADVNTLDVITNAQITAGIAAGSVRKMYEQSFVGSSGARLNIAPGTPFMKGLALRFSNSGPTGTMKATIVSDGGFMKVQISG
jgi:hypothetical protein